MSGEIRRELEAAERFDSARGRAAALVRWAYEDPTTASDRAREANLRRFERAVDPENLLSPAERETRARRLMRAHMIRLAQRSRAKRAAKTRT